MILYRLRTFDCIEMVVGTAHNHMRQFMSALVAGIMICGLSCQQTETVDKRVPSGLSPVLSKDSLDECLTVVTHSNRLPLESEILNALCAEFGLKIDEFVLKDGESEPGWASFLYEVSNGALHFQIYVEGIPDLGKYNETDGHEPPYIIVRVKHMWVKYGGNQTVRYNFPR